MTNNTMMSTTRRRTGTGTRTPIRMPCGFLLVLVLVVVVVVTASFGQDVVSARTMTTTAEKGMTSSSSPYFQHTRRQRLLEDGVDNNNNDAGDDDNLNDNDDDNNNNNNNVVDNEYFGYDLADFSLRFERCQYIKMFDADAVEDEYLNDNNPFSIRHFVVFRLCPSDTCSSDCDGVDHGQYVIQADEYLQSTVQQQSERFEEMCNSCQDDCFYQNDDDDDAAAAAANEDEGDEEDANNNNGGGGASSACLSSEGCGRLCYLQDNLEANGYVDAADYLECQAVDMQNYYNTYGYANNNNNNNGDDDGDGENNVNDDADGVNDDDGYEFQLYIGPRCSQSGNRVMLGLFYDQYCLTPFTDLKPEKVLGYEISYAMLQHTLATDGSNCLSCKEEDEEDQQDANNNNNNNNNADANDRADADNVNEMCEVVYTDAGKCETKYGIEGGFIQTNVYANGGDQVNQVENEYRVCTWIESLMLDAYDESGEINLQGDQVLIYREVTQLQKTTFSLLFLTVVSLVVAGYFTQRQISKSSPKIDLSSQTDAVIT